LPIESIHYNLSHAGLQLPGTLLIAPGAECIIINQDVGHTEAASGLGSGPAEDYSGSTGISEGQTIILL
jgi:hypothetical protein